MSPKDTARSAPQSLNAILRESARRLDAVTDSPWLDAELLLCHALQCSRTTLHTRHRDRCAPPPYFQTFLARRLRHEPIAYILGSWEFYGLEFRVRPPILIPRPETELLVEVGLDFLGDAPRDVLEIGTGSGCVAVTLAWHAPQARICATDINPDALALAQENAARRHVHLRLIQGDLFQPLAALPGGQFDLIVSNPPYVESTEWESLAPDIRQYEDVGALLSGEDGLDCIRKIIAEARNYLRPGGLLAFEMGERQWPIVQGLLQEAGYTQVRVSNDLAGTPRIAQGKMPEE